MQIAFIEVGHQILHPNLSNDISRHDIVKLNDGKTIDSTFEHGHRISQFGLVNSDVVRVDGSNDRATLEIVKETRATSGGQQQVATVASRMIMTSGKA